MARMDSEWCLALETSIRPGGVALLGEGGTLAVRALDDTRRNAAGMLPAIAALLHGHGIRARDLDVVCFSHGPGSFTGLRVAAAAARVLKATTGCSVAAAPTLEVIARNAIDVAETGERIVVLRSAGSGRVYVASYERDGDGLRCVMQPATCDDHRWMDGIEPPFCVLGDAAAIECGGGVAKGGRVLDEDTWLPRVEQVALLGRELAAAGRFCSADQISPLYLRPPACEEVYETRRAAAILRRGEAKQGGAQ